MHLPRHPFHSNFALLMSFHDIMTSLPSHVPKKSALIFVTMHQAVRLYESAKLQTDAQTGPILLPRLLTREVMIVHDTVTSNSLFILAYLGHYIEFRDSIHARKYITCTAIDGQDCFIDPLSF